MIFDVIFFFFFLTQQDRESLLGCEDGNDLTPRPPLDGPHITSSLDAPHSNGEADAIWQLSAEQQAYYTKQFRRLQADVSKASIFIYFNFISAHIAMWNNTHKKK